MRNETLRGKLLVLEGGDGSGKGTQTGRLRIRLEGLGYFVRVYDFPRYYTFFGQEVGALMRGEYGPFKNVHPFLAAMLYAGDRLDAAPQMRADIGCGAIVLCNRYVASNLAHGGAKFNTNEEALDFIRKVEFMEYGVNQLPQPNLQLFLDVPPARARVMLSTKKEREYMNRRGLDLAEADLSHQEKAVMMYRWLCENRVGFVRLECGLENGDIKTEGEIEEMIWEQLVARGWV